MNWKHIVAGVAGFALGIWLCLPREMALQQRWEVLVTDAAGHGISGATVKQVRRDFAPRAPESTLQQFADVDGRAAFPAVHVRSSPLMRGIFCLRRKIGHDLAASCSYQQEISAAAEGYVEAARSERDIPLRERGRLLRITMQPVR